MDKKIELINHLLRENIISYPYSRVYYIRISSGINIGGCGLTMIIDKYDEGVIEWGDMLLSILNIDSYFMFRTISSEIGYNKKNVPAWVLYED